jgi:hypothetical protein
LDCHTKYLLEWKQVCFAKELRLVSAPGIYYSSMLSSSRRYKTFFFSVTDEKAKKAGLFAEDKRSSLIWFVVTDGEKKVLQY